MEDEGYEESVPFKVYVVRGDRLVGAISWLCSHCGMGAYHLLAKFTSASLTYSRVTHSRCRPGARYHIKEGKMSVPLRTHV